MAVSIFHQCLIRSQPFAGTHRFLAGLFTFLSRQPTVNGAEPVEGTGAEILELSSKYNYFFLEFSALSFLTWCWATKCDQAWVEMNGRKLVIYPETDIDSKLPLTLFNVTHPGLAAARVDMF